jgi:hypothetical protein
MQSNSKTLKIVPATGEEGPLLRLFSTTTGAGTIRFQAAANERSNSELPTQ